MDPIPGTFRPQQISVQAGAPLIFSDLTSEVDEQDLRLSEEDSGKCHAVGKTLKAYLLAARNLLATKYADMKHYAPPHLSQESFPTVVIASDGILVRYEMTPNPDTLVRVGIVLAPLADLAPMLSESVVYCPPDPKNFVPATGGVTIDIVGQNPVTSEQTPILKFKAALIVSLPSATDRTDQIIPGRPNALASVQRQI